MSMRMRRDVKFYCILAVLVVIIFIVISRTTKTKQDFRKAAKAKVQLTSELRSPPSSCKAQEVLDGNFKHRVTIIVSSQAHEDAVITQTVLSILAHTDPSILEEIIISANKQVSKEKMQLLVKEFSVYSPLVSIVQGQDENRLKNKLVAGHLAKGDVVVFIDDTVVVTANYLSPLLHTLQEHPETIAVPSYDYLTEMTASVEKSWTQMKWMFGWRLDIEAFELSFQEIASKSEQESSPAMVFDSSAFAIHKTYLEKLGSIKNGMHYTGSIDLSFTTWLCGGGAYVVPCSRVAKVQSQSGKAILPGDDKTKHFIAERYFTEQYLHVFKRVNPAKVTLSEEEEAHLKIEKNFQKKCPKDFNWYMKQVVKDEVFIPSSEAVAYGYFNSNSGRVCFRQTPAMIFLGYFGCKMHTRGKMVEYLKSGQLRTGNECITSGGKAGNYMVTDSCDYKKDSFKWQTSKLRQFKDSLNRCISHSTDPYPEEHERQVLMFTDCTDTSDPNNLQWQKWNSFIWLE